jgi:biopolymer transport protein ExbB/TolQ
MNEFIDFILSNNGAAIAIALLIFIVTVWLVIKRLIGFVITIILLAFALISGFAVANADLVREIIKNLAGKSTPQEQQTLDQLKQQVFKSYDEIRKEFSQQKEEFQKLLNKLHPESTPQKPAETKPSNEKPAQ